MYNDNLPCLNTGFYLLNYTTLFPYLKQKKSSEMGIKTGYKIHACLPVGRD